MFLISFAKSLPRLASIAAFLCLVVAHLEWPDMSVYLVVASAARRCSSYPRPGPGTTGGPGRRHRPRGGKTWPSACPCRTATILPRLAPRPGEDLDPGSCGLHPRRADEDGVHRLDETGEVQVALERVDLPAEGVAPDRMSRPPMGLLVLVPPSMRSASMIIPAQVPKVGIPSYIRCRSGSKRSKSAPTWPSWSTRHQG